MQSWYLRPCLPLKPEYELDGPIVRAINGRPVIFSNFRLTALEGFSKSGTVQTSRSYEGMLWIPYHPSSVVSKPGWTKLVGQITQTLVGYNARGLNIEGLRDNLLVTKMLTKWLMLTIIAKTVTDVLQLSPTHFVSNIRHQNRCVTMFIHSLCPISYSNCEISKFHVPDFLSS